MVTCKHTAWCDARTTTKDFWHPHSTCATCVPSGRLHEPTTGTSMFHTIVIGSFMKIILSTHYTLSFVLTHCKLIALHKAAHIPLLHSIMWRIFYTYSGLFLTCLPHYKLTDDGFTVFFCLWCMFLPWQARVLRSGPGHWRLPRLCGGFPLVPPCPPHLQMDGSGHARAPSPPPCRLPLPILWTGNWSCRKLQQDWQMNTLHCYKGQRYS